MAPHIIYVRGVRMLERSGNRDPELDSRAGWLGIDVGSVSTDIVIINDEIGLQGWAYLPTGGAPIEAIKEGLKKVKNSIPVLGVGATGSGRELAGVITGADIVKNEITAHAVAATYFVPDVCTVIEIGGRTQKLSLLETECLLTLL